MQPGIVAIRNDWDSKIDLHSTADKIILRHWFKQTESSGVKDIELSAKEASDLADQLSKKVESMKADQEKRDAASRQRPNRSEPREI